MMALSTITDNRMPKCVAKRTAEWLLGTELNSEADMGWIEELARQFVFSDLKFKALVKSIVTDDRYRRVR